MSQVWMMKWKGEDLTLNIVTQMSDVPYAAYFNLDEYITITNEG